MTEQERSRLRMMANKLKVIAGHDQDDADHLIYERYVAGGMEDAESWLQRVSDDIAITTMAGEFGEVGSPVWRSAMARIEDAYQKSGLAGAHMELETLRGQQWSQG